MTRAAAGAAAEASAQLALDRAKHELEVGRLELERQRHETERCGKAIDLIRARNESINTLRAVADQMRMIQDGEKTIIEGEFMTTTLTRQGREWNPLEEQIANLTLISLRRLVQQSSMPIPAE